MRPVPDRQRSHVPGIAATVQDRFLIEQAPLIFQRMSDVAREAACALFVLSDKDTLDSLAEDQGMGPALNRLATWMKDA